MPKKTWDVAAKKTKLQQAAEKGDLAALRAALAAKVPLERYDESFRTALMIAAEKGQRAAFDALVEAGADPQAYQPPGWWPGNVFGLAIVGGNCDLVRWFLDQGTDINARLGDPTEDQERRHTPLLVAVNHGKLEVVQLLLAAGADLTAVWDDRQQRRSALDLAEDDGPFDSAKIKKAKQQIAELLRAAGAPSVKQSKPSSQSQLPKLHQAALRGDAEQLRALLASGTPVDARDPQHYTALMRAACAGHEEAFRVLREAGADWQAADKAGTDILTCAAEGGNVAIIRQVLDGGFPVDGPPEPPSGDTLANLQKIGDQVARGQGRPVRDFGRMTPLMLAAFQGHVEAARLLLEKGADPNARYGSETPRGYARMNRHQAVVDLLLASGARDSRKDPARAALKGFATAADQPAFQKALGRLAELAGKPPTEWEKRKGVYRSILRKVDSLAQRYKIVSTGRQKIEVIYDVVERMQDEFRAAGFLLIQADLIEPQKLLLFPTDDPYAVIAARGTNGVNYGITTEDIIAWLRDLEKTDPFILTACSHDGLAGRFPQPVTDATGLAQRMLQFCPDLDSVESVVSEMRTGDFGFWWD